MHRHAKAGAGILATSFGVTFVGLVLFHPAVEHVVRRPVVHENTAPRTATLLFTGDLMFDRYIRVRMEGGVDPLHELTDLLSAPDLTIGNLEGPITGGVSQSVGTKPGDPTNMHFTFPLTTPDFLTAHGFDLLALGNNHILDQGPGGARETTHALTRAGLRYVGDPTTTAGEPLIQEVNGIRLAFVSYSAFRAGDAERTEAAIHTARTNADAVIVLPHWGTEYQAAPPERVRELAARFANAGADLIIGTHPHVIGEVADLGSTRVYYSLGNFVFDQYFSREVRCGLLVSARVTKVEGKTSITYEEARAGMHPDGTTVLGCE